MRYGLLDLNKEIVINKETSCQKVRTLLSMEENTLRVMTTIRKGKIVYKALS